MFNIQKITIFILLDVLKKILTQLEFDTFTQNMDIQIEDGGGGNVTIKAGEAGDLGAGGHFHVGGRSPTVKQSKSVTFKDC